MGGWVYIVTNRENGVLYTGVTSDIARRSWEHRTGAVAGFTKRYNCTRLVLAERHDDIRTAIAREKAIKSWAARLEGRSHRADQPGLGGPLRPPRRRNITRH